MGRVDQALKRAANEASGSSDQAADASTAELFPSEGVETTGGARDVLPDVQPDEPVLARAPEVAPAPFSEFGAMRLSTQLDSKIVVDTHMLPASREEYRRLAAALHHAQEASGAKLVMIASAVAGEGKSLTAANLALTLSESYKRRVLLIDADLRRPTQHRFFGLDATNGLSDALTAADEPQLTLHEISPMLTILPAGRPDSDPMAGLTSVRMRRLLDEARDAYDWVLVDTPPVGLMSDAKLLAAMTDLAILVIKANGVSFEEIQAAAEALGRDKILGTVLNRVTAEGRRASYQYYSYYHATTPKAASRT